MRSSPALQVTVRDFSVWRVAVLILCTSALALLIAWGAAATRAQDVPRQLLAFAAAMAAAGLGRSLWRTDPVQLAFDGSTWTLRNPDDDRTQAIVGEPRICVDLDGWLLIRFATKAARTRSVWLGLQRRAVGEPWHALRCALYLPRPPATDDPAQGGRVAPQGSDERP